METTQYGESGPWWARLFLQAGALGLLSAVLYGLYALGSTLILENALPIGKALIAGIHTSLELQEAMLEEFQRYNQALIKEFQKQNQLLARQVDILTRTERDLDERQGM